MYTVHWHVSERLPIFKGYRQHVLSEPLIVRVKAKKAYTQLAWQIITPGLASSTGRITLMNSAAGIPTILQGGGAAEIHLVDTGV